MMFKAMTGWSFTNQIEAIEVLRETEQCVFLKGVPGTFKQNLRENKVSDSHEYHDTWEAARDALLRRANSERETLLARLANADKRIASIQAMAAPGAGG